MSLRIPQRKPWGSMQEKVESAKTLVQERNRLMEGVPETKRDEGERLIDDIATSLGRLELRISEQNADRVSIRVADVLTSLSDLKLLQTPGLPYLIPKAYSGRPRLVGRATVQFQLETQSSSDGSDVVEIVLDGYSAPLSAGSFAFSVLSHSFDRQSLAVDRDIVALRTNGGNQQQTLPLEILAEGEFEPLYRTELDVQTGEVPVLPMSIFGSVSLSHAVDGEEMSSPSEAFIFKFDRSTAGLGGMAFDEGRFSVIGYVTKGIETVKRLQSGDRIVRAEITKGRENLVRPDDGSPSAISQM